MTPAEVKKHLDSIVKEAELAFEWMWRLVSRHPCAAEEARDSIHRMRENVAILREALDDEAKDDEEQQAIALRETTAREVLKAELAQERMAHDATKMLLKIERLRVAYWKALLAERQAESAHRRGATLGDYDAAASTVHAAYVALDNAGGKP